MSFSLSQGALLKPLQLVSGAVERRQTLPILSNILLSVTGNQLSLTATDLELELSSHVELEGESEDGSVTVSARKFLDICRTLPADEKIKFKMKNDRAILSTQKSKFILSTLSADEFPKVEEGNGQIAFSVAQKTLKNVLASTHFAIPQQDVRYYLNGMLFDLREDELRLIATDGHRLSLGSIDGLKLKKGNNAQVIVPRKGVMELMRLLNDSDDMIEFIIGSNHIYAMTSEFKFISKLIEGKFPDYTRVIPKKGDKVVEIDREILKQAFTRVAILSNEKYRGIRLFLSENVLRISANNPEQEEAEEDLLIEYNGGELEIGFNVNYLIDVCQAIESSTIKLIFADSNSSLLVEEDQELGSFTYVVMPMRL
ncbi:MAG: DNA polymerase III subunit beta [Pseudomonadota bacterium]